MNAVAILPLRPRATRITTPPTGRQLQVLNVIRDFIAANGLPPTIREIGNALGIRSTNGVCDHLKALERRGLITVGANAKTRCIRLVGEPLSSESTGEVVGGGALPPFEIALMESAVARARARLASLRGWLPPMANSEIDLVVAELNVISDALALQREWSDGK